MATLSVVIPNYNRADLIGETLGNVLAQSRAPDEVVVVDDGSTDASCEVIAGFGKAVRLIRQENRGPGAARNRGLGEARGELIQFMDSDDLWSRDKLERQEAALLADPGAGFAYSPWLQARLEGGEARHAEPVLQQRALPPTRTPVAWFLRGWVIVFQCCLFRRAVLDAAGPYREDLMPSEDSELLFRILKSGARPLHVPEALVLYRLHGGDQISRGGMAAQRRAADWTRFVGAVAGQLDEAPGLSAADLRHWRWREAEAGLASELEMVNKAFRRAERLSGRVRGAIARRSGGSSFGAAYAPGPVTAAQAEQLAAIGYTPRRISHAELEN